MLFSIIISTIDSLKSLCGSSDFFTTATLSDILLLDETLFRPLPCIFLLAILGEFDRSFTPAGELTEYLRTELFFCSLTMSDSYSFLSSTLGLVMIGGRSISEIKSNPLRLWNFEAVSSSNLQGQVEEEKTGIFGSNSGRSDSLSEEVARGESG
ncbi:hypothetical protein LguiA_016485 [Lonicera macranthoides]